MGFLKALVKMKWVAGLLIIFLVWQAMVFFGVRPRAYSDAEKMAIERVCQNALMLTETRLQPRQEMPVLGITHLINDSSSFFSETLNTNFHDSSVFTVRDGSVLQQFLADVMGAVKNATSLEEVAFAANHVELDLVACGKVESVREENGIGFAALNFYLYDVLSAEWIIQETIEADSRMPQEAWLLRHWELLAALLVVVLIPLLSFKLIERVVEKNSNSASAALFAGLVAIDLLLFWWAGLFGATVAVPIICVLLSVCYNLVVCEWMTRKVQ